MAALAFLPGGSIRRLDIASKDCAGQPVGYAHLGHKAQTSARLAAGVVETLKGLHRPAQETVPEVVQGTFAHAPIERSGAAEWAVWVETSRAGRDALIGTAGIKVRHLVDLDHLCPTALITLAVLRQDFALCDTGERVALRSAGGLLLRLSLRLGLGRGHTG